MEFLVTMTTHVPSGTSDGAVQQIRDREAARARELAAEGHLLRLWRPPLAPGEWRTLGLFAAEDADQLEKLLASMPLRVWRSDEVTALAPHGNDPRPATSDGSPGPEFFTEFAVTAPNTSQKDYREAVTGEAKRARALAAQGHLLRLWALPKKPGISRALGLWRAKDAAEMQEILASLPLKPWMNVQSIALAPHPSDPAIAAD